MPTNQLNKIPFLYFEWSMIDQCNLNCSYCIVKGFKSQRKWPSVYKPGIELEVAGKIKELAPLAEVIHINLTGGEPTLSTYFEEAMEIIFSIPNANISLITNLLLPDKVIPYVEKFKKITISTHIQNRTDEQAEQLIEDIREIAPRMRQAHGAMAFQFNVVDYKLTPRDALLLNRILVSTGIDSIKRLKYIHPIFDSTNNLLSPEDAHYVPEKVELLGKINPADFSPEELSRYKKWQKDYEQEREAHTAHFHQLFDRVKNQTRHLPSPIHKNIVSDQNSFNQNDHMKRQNLIPAQGKRCAFGNFILLVDPDGMIYFNVCPTEKDTPPINILNVKIENFDAIMSSEMKICNHDYCHCNYNYFAYELYLQAAYEKNYHYSEVFPVHGLWSVYDDT